MHIFLFLLIAMLPVSFLQAAEPYDYSPSPCEFNITFPSEPAISKKCNDDGKKCYEQAMYIKVFGANATINIRAICNPVDAELKDHYSGDVMQATLKAMTRDTVVKTFDTTFSDENTYKQATLIGEGKSGAVQTLFVGQLWIGEKSALSVEAELIGDAAEVTDEMFGDILKSIVYKKEKVDHSSDTNNAKESEPAEP